jgi:uracil-DNA glycosylase
MINHPIAPLSFDLSAIDPSWQSGLQSGLKAMDPNYLTSLSSTTHWLPGSHQIFNAFSLPVDNVKYVLFGESPYPRAQSANGYAFWDAAVTGIWSDTGLSKTVNRATSLRNIIKMLLIAEGLLDAPHTTQTDIAKIDKATLVKTLPEFFSNLLGEGFLLLNATLVLQPNNVKNDARAWRPFLKQIIDFLLNHNPEIELILLGNIANEIDPLITQTGITKLYAEHPYNLTFIHNPAIIKFFTPMHLLKKRQDPVK